MKTVQPVIRGQVSTALVRVSNRRIVQFYYTSWRETATYMYLIQLHYLQISIPVFAVLIVFSSLDIKFDELYWSIFISNPFITTDPDLEVINCGRRQLYIEPWW